MREDIANQRHDRAECYLADDAVSVSVHLEEKCNRNDRTNGPAHCGEEYVLETECSQNVAACHHEKASDPCACKLFDSRPGKTARPQFIDREPTQVQRRHTYSPFKLIEMPKCDSYSPNANNIRIALGSIPSDKTAKTFGLGYAGGWRQNRGCR
jgi:hypothetical protein